MERIVYQNGSTNFTVARVRTRDAGDSIAVVGNLVGINPGESVSLSGQWVNSEKYGRQFKVETFEAVPPATADGIRDYLSSGLIRGLGPMMAGRLVELFGEHTLEVIESSPERLAEVEGIGKKRIALITGAWEEQREIRNVMIFLKSHGVSSTYAAKIFKHYGKDSIAIVRTNPYRLAADIRGIGFLTADRIAGSLGLPPDSPMWAQEGLVHILGDLVSTFGHVCYPLEPLVAKAAGLLGVEREIVSRAVDRLLEEGRIVIESMGAADAPDADASVVYLSASTTPRPALRKAFLP